MSAPPDPPRPDASVLKSPPSPPPKPVPLPPIAALRSAIGAAGPGAHAALIERALAAAAHPAAAHVCTAVFADSARAAACRADDALRAGLPLLPLAGLPVTVKALFDVAGAVTHAGAALWRQQPPADADAPAVARLRAAGAAIVAHTNLSEFAFSGVGLNPHFGTPRHPCDDAVARIPGGSSSGAAVSVALGVAVAALGSDTAGSIRVPAALCGLVGFKSTQRRVPLAGAVPLSRVLDTACAMARTVADCVVVDGVLAGAPLAVAPRPPRALRLALPGTLLIDDLDPAVAAAFERALATLSAAGVQIVPQPLAELAEIASINAPGGLSPVEAYAQHRELFETRREQLDPRVAARIAAGRGVGAAEWLLMLQRRSDWIARLQRRLAGFDAIVCPTVPMLAPPLEPLRHDDALFFATNGRLLRHTLVANFLDGCAITLPCHAPGELPVGLMLTAQGGHDAALLSAALTLEALLQPVTAPAAERATPRSGAGGVGGAR